MCRVLQGYCAKLGCDVHDVAGFTALGEGVMYRVLQAYCTRRGCDVQGVTGVNAIGV